MDELSSLIKSSIENYFPLKEKKENSLDAFELLLTGHLHDEESSSRIKWNAFLEKLRTNTICEIRDVTNLQFPAFICSIAIEEFKIRNIQYFRNVFITFSLIGNFYTISERVILKTEVDGRSYETFLLLKTYQPNENDTNLYSIYSELIQSYVPEYHFVSKSLWNIQISDFSLPQSIKDKKYLIYNFLFGNISSWQFSIGD